MEILLVIIFFIDYYGTKQHLSQLVRKKKKNNNKINKTKRKNQNYPFLTGFKIDTLISKIMNRCLGFLNFINHSICHIFCPCCQQSSPHKYLRLIIDACIIDQHVILTTFVKFQIYLKKILSPQRRGKGCNLLSSQRGTVEVNGHGCMYM